MKKLLSLLLVLSMVFSFAACTDTENKDPKDDGIKHAATDIALETENFNCTRGEVSYIFYRNYNDFQYNQSDSFDMYNIDKDTSLKEQEYHDGITWFDTILEESVTYLEDLLVWCECAKADGMELDEEDQKTIDQTIKNWKNYATDYDYTIEELLAKQYNSDVTLKTIERYMEKEILAQKYVDKLTAGYSFTEEEKENFVKENTDAFYSINYIGYIFDEDTFDGAKAAADELASITDPQQFTDYIDNYMQENLVLEERKNIEDCVYDYIAYNEHSEFSKWAFGDEAKPNTVYTEYDEVGGEYAVYLLTATPSLQEYNTRHARLLTVNVSNHNSFQETLATANKLWEQWKAGEATEESFEALVKEKSEDKNSASYGGLYESISRADEGIANSVKDWIFDEAQNPGDTTVVKGDMSYVVVYYVGEGDVQWKHLAKNGLTSKKYTEDGNAAAEKYKVTKDDNVLQSIEA